MLRSARIAPAYLKIRRAVEHLQALDDLVDRWFEKNGERLFELHGEPNSQRTKYLFRTKLLLPSPQGVPPQIPGGHWGVMVGDAVHCLRSALDQLVFSCASDQGSHLAYPVCKNRRDWVTRSPAVLWSVPRKYVTVIRDTQPYRSEDVGAHPLSVLSGLSNLDKHQSIPTMAFVAQQGTITATDWKGIASFKTITLTGRPLVHDAVIAQCRIEPDDTGIDPQMNVEYNISLTPAFGEIAGISSISHEPVGDVFNRLVRFVKETADAFRDA